MNSAVENSAVENTGAEEDSESPLAKRAKTSSRDDTLPPELDGLTEKDYHRITSAEVVLDKDHSAHGFEKGERYSMAMSIASEDGDQPAIDITKLHLSKLRKLGKNFGIKMISKMPSAVIRIHLARNSHIGSILDNGTNLRPPAPPEKIKQNTIVRLVNVIFSQGFIQGLMEWNNHRKRADHETGVGGTMDRFFVQVRTAMYGLDDGGEENIADVDDSHEQRSLDSLDTGDEDDNFGLQRDDLLLERTTGANDPYASLSRFEERTDLDHDKVKLYFETVDLNPGKYMKMPSQTLHSWTKDLLRARKKLLENMKKSGEHDSDMYSFVRIALKGTNLVKTIGEFTLYYFCLKASSVPDFDKTFSPFMDGRLKGDSTSTFGRDDEVSAMTGGRDTVLTSQEQSMERMAISFELIQQCTCSANERQMRLAALQEAGILEKRLQRADDGSPLRPDIRARMQAKLEKLYEDLY